MIAGVSLTNAYFQLHKGSIERRHIIDVLRALVKHIRRPCGLPGMAASASIASVRDYSTVSMVGALGLSATLCIRSQPSRILVAWPKRHAVANSCLNSIADLADTARSELKPSAGAHHAHNSFLETGRPISDDIYLILYGACCKGDFADKMNAVACGILTRDQEMNAT